MVCSGMSLFDTTSPALHSAAMHIVELQRRLRDTYFAILTQAILGVVSNLARVFLDSEQARADEVADTAVAFCLRGLLGD